MKRGFGCFVLLLLSVIVPGPFQGSAVFGEEDEWGAPPAAAGPASGRDEDARRRLTDLETWKRKLEARAAKEVEEQGDKTRFELSGKYKLRFNSRGNLNLDNPARLWPYDNTSFFDQRFQLKLEALYGPLSSVLLLDKGNFVFDWKEDSEGTLERWGEFFTVTSPLVRELYVQYTGGLIIKAGRQNTALGNGGLVLEGPVDSLKLATPLRKTIIGPVSASLAYVQVAGGFANYDGMTYPPGAGNRGNALLGAATKLDAGLFSLDIRPARGLRIGPYVLKAYDRGGPGGPDLNLDKDYDSGTAPRDGSFEPLWTGLAASGKSGGFSYTADVVYLTGSYTKERDFRADAALVRGAYALGKRGAPEKFSLGLEAGRGSGNTAEEKVSGTGRVKDFTSLFLCRERRKFGNIFSEDLRAGYFLADSNLANVTFLRAIAGFKPSKALRADFALVRLWTTESVYEGRGPVRDWSAGASVATEKTRDLGWEADLNIGFPIHRRLKGFAELGYFIPGDAYRRPDGQKADPASELVLGAEFEF